MDHQLERNKEVIKRFNYGCIQGGDRTVGEALLHPLFVNHTVPAGAGGDKAGTLDFIEIMRQAFPDIKVEILMQVAEGDLVTTHKSFQGTHLGEWMGIAPTGRKVNFRVIDVLRVKDGLATDHWSVRDNMALYQQLTQANG